MTRTIADAFASGKALVPFVTAGDPSLGLTERLVHAMAEAGAGIIELGAPFSDPTAGSTFVQESNLRALGGGTTTDGVFDMVRRIRESGCDVPLVLVAYANVAYGYGTGRFARTAAGCGLQGIALLDVPFEERAEFEGPLGAEGLDLVGVMAPSSPEHMRGVAGASRGLVCCSCSPGVHGLTDQAVAEVGDMVAAARATKGAPPVVAGLGVSTPDQAGRLARLVDGVIVESEVVRLVSEHGEDAVGHVTRYVRDMAEAVRRTG